MRIWGEYLYNQPQTLFEFTRELNNENNAVVDISLVDAIGSSFNLFNNILNITGDFNNNVCYYANSPYKNNGCLSPCSRFNDDYSCCKGNYNTPQTCKKENDYYLNKWCDAIKSFVIPPKVYCYAYDDKDGTLTNFGDYLILTFWNNNNFIN